MITIISYNVNGLRSALQKGWLDWIQSQNADMICLQEVKAMPEQLPLSDFEALGYHSYWFPAQKKGYSGVGILTRKKPKQVVFGMDMPDYDAEGRVLRADFDTFSVLSTYFPSGTSGDHRQDFKYRFLDDFFSYIQSLRQKLPHLVIAGDVNICHHPIDIHNPISNKNSTGFLPEERAWVTKLLHSGFIDTFRHFNPEPHRYTWWSYRANARSNNKGWRIDYQFITEEMRPYLKAADILSNAIHSDHCPTTLTLAL